MPKLIIPGKPCYRIVCDFDGRGRVVIEVTICGQVDITTFMAGGVRYNFGAPDCPWHPTREAAIQHYQAADSDKHVAFQIYAAATLCERHFEFVLLSDSADAAEQLNAKVPLLPLCQEHPIIRTAQRRLLTESPSGQRNQTLPA